jgi:hypothetical protein
MMAMVMATVIARMIGRVTDGDVGFRIIIGSDGEGDVLVMMLVMAMVMARLTLMGMAMASGDDDGNSSGGGLRCMQMVGNGVTRGDTTTNWTRGALGAQ